MHMVKDSPNAFWSKWLLDQCVYAGSGHSDACNCHHTAVLKRAKLQPVFSTNNIRSVNLSLRWNYDLNISFILDNTSMEHISPSTSFSNFDFRNNSNNLPQPLIVRSGFISSSLLMVFASQPRWNNDWRETFNQISFQIFWAASKLVAWHFLSSVIGAFMIGG